MRLHASLALLLATSLALPADGVAKSYQHPAIDQTVTVQEDGTLEIVDTRSYAFEGEFHRAFLTVDPRQGGTVAFEGVEAVDGGSVRNDRVEGQTIRWEYDARDERRTFRIRYRLTGEVERASDAALIDRQFLEPQHAPVSDYRLTLNLPRPAGLFKIFVITARGVMGQLDVDPEAGRGFVHMTDLAADEWVRFRILIDAAQVSGLAMADEGPRYEAWLTETSNITQSYRAGAGRQLAAGRAPRRPFPTPVAGLFVLVSLAFSWWSYRTYRSRGVEPRVGDVGQYYREPAEEIPPAAVPFVMDQLSPGISVAAQALGATLLDLARRGFLTLSEREKAKFLGLGGGTEVDFKIARNPGPGDLTPFESQVWGMLDEARGDDDTVSPSELKKYFLRHRTWIQNWCAEPRKWYESAHGPLLAGGHVGLMVLMILGAVVIMGGMIFLGAFSANQVVFAVAVVSGVVAGLTGLICGVALPRWRPEALIRARKWKAYGKFLSDFSAMEEAPAEHYKLWDYHFVYATALGVAQKYLANLKKLMTQHPERFSSPAWIMAASAHSGALDSAGALNAVQSNLASLQANLSALQSALSTTTSSGGGFSGGGAGGSSGGGGASGAG